MSLDLKHYYDHFFLRTTTWETTAEIQAKVNQVFASIVFSDISYRQRVVRKSKQKS